MKEQVNRASQNIPIPDSSAPTINIDLRQSEYDFKYLAFPSDLGTDPMGHYMVININAPTKFMSTEYAGQYTNQFTPLNRIQKSKVDVLRYGNNLTTGPVSVGGGSNTPLASIPRATRRIKESIALHMPTPLVFNHQNEYEEISLTALGGSVGVAVGKAVGGLGGSLPGRLGSIVGGAGSIIGGISGGISSDPRNNGSVAQAAMAAQSPINPMVEILFSTTPQRQFVFEVLLSPRNENESEIIHKIIKTIRFHGTPELNSLVGGLMWIPPAEFDITFFNKGEENFNILRINTCVLERCEVDYAPTSGVYSTFRNGHPVAVRLSLGFRELAPITKREVLAGF